MTIVRHVIVHGRVQRVGFRAFVEREALVRGIEGWVRNRHDGSVEALFAGGEDVVAGMIEACRQGPLGAHVEVQHERDSDGEDLKLRRRGELFSVLPTA
jgi:acylphosphatase